VGDLILVEHEPCGGLLLDAKVLELGDGKVDGHGVFVQYQDSEQDGWVRLEHARPITPESRAEQARLKEKFEQVVADAVKEMHADDEKQRREVEEAEAEEADTSDEEPSDGEARALRRQLRQRQLRGELQRLKQKSQAASQVLQQFDAQLGEMQQQLREAQTRASDAAAESAEWKRQYELEADENLQCKKRPRDVLAAVGNKRRR